MGRVGAGLIAAVLALTGCKSTDPKSTDKDAAGTTASRNKGSEGKVPSWLEGSDRSAASDGGESRNLVGQDGVAGRVFDPSNRPLANVYIQVELVNAPPNGRAAVGIYSDSSGAFSTQGLKAGKAYNLTAEATLNGKLFTASVQTLVPNPNINLVLRDDLGLPPVGNLKGPGAGAFPSQPSAQDVGGDRIPPMGFPPAPRPNDGSWTPGAESSRPVPTNIAPSTPRPNPTQPGGIPAPDDLSLPPKPAMRPENIADGPKNPWAAPPATIPGPPLPQSFPNPPPPSPPDPSNSRMGNSGMGFGTGTGTGFILLDTLERTWEFPANKSGSIVLVEFMTTTCDYSKNVIPVIADLQSRYANAGLQVIAIACDDMSQKQRIAASAKYAKDNNLNYPIYVEPGDTAGSVRNRYNITGYPTVVLLDGRGAVLWQGHPNKRADSTRTELEVAILRLLGK